MANARNLGAKWVCVKWLCALVCTTWVLYQAMKHLETPRNAAKHCETCSDTPRNAVRQRETRSETPRNVEKTQWNNRET